MITLRDVRPEDADKLRTWRNLPQISKYMYKDHYITAEEHEAWFCSALTDSTRWYWIISCDGDHKKGGRSLCPPPSKPVDVRVSTIAR